MILKLEFDTLSSNADSDYSITNFFISELDVSYYLSL